MDFGFVRRAIGIESGETFVDVFKFYVCIGMLAIVLGTILAVVR